MWKDIFVRIAASIFAQAFLTIAKTIKNMITQKKRDKQKKIGFYKTD